MSAQLIGLYSPAPQSGKTTVAQCLVAQGYTIVPFAEPMKLMLAPMLECLGYSEAEIKRRLYVHKEELIPELKVSTRHLLQTLGTEWGRSCVAPDVWLNLWRCRVSRLGRVVVDDVRFPNEAELVRSLGGEVWKLTRPGALRGKSHASEGSLDSWAHFSRYIVNNGTVAQLTDAIAALPLGQDGPHP